MLSRSTQDPAVTRFTTAAVAGCSGRPLRAFLLKPITGRTHQLRVALKSLGAPVLGDEVRGRVRGGVWGRAPSAMHAPAHVHTRPGGAWRTPLPSPALPAPPAAAPAALCGGRGGLERGPRLPALRSYALHPGRPAGAGGVPAGARRGLLLRSVPAAICRLAATQLGGGGGALVCRQQAAAVRACDRHIGPLACPAAPSQRRQCCKCVCH